MHPAGVRVPPEPLDRRADLSRKEAESHRLREQGLEASADHLESIARNPWREAQLPSALYQAGRWSQQQALEMERERSSGPLPSARFKELAAEARRDAIQAARAYREAARHHARQRRRYEHVAMDPWLTIQPDPATPGR